METSQRVIITSEITESDPWPVYWSAVFAGALSAIAMTTLLGLIGTSIGLHSLSDVKDFTTWHEITLGDLAGVVLGIFFSYVVGGWVSGRITNSRLSEPTILHGALSWLVTIPSLVVLLALGAGKAFGGWYNGIITVSSSNSTRVVVPDPLVIKHTAMAGATVLLLGLIGSVIGGWMASGEPMSITHHKTRKSLSHPVR